jgi:amidohydrolase
VTNDLSTSLLADARTLQPETVALRRHLHAHPEVGLRLPATQQQVLAALDGLPLTVHTGTAISSVIAVLDGAGPGPTVLLRGDMDALPLHEDTGLDFASAVPDAMHACGHDTHAAMLVSAARVLAARRAQFAGRVAFMFQPGEEGFHGARHMLEEGLLDLAAAGAEPVSAAFALHISTAYRSRTVHVRPGPMLASSDVLRIEVRGRGGHASNPSAALDPIPVACEIVQAIQAMVTRRIDAFDPAVVTVTQIVAGTADNIIPERAELIGTVRALSELTREAVHRHLLALAPAIAAAHGAVAEVEIEPGYPVTVNAASAAELLRVAARDVVGASDVEVMANPIMGAEDWSYVLQRVPGAMAFLGACPPGLDPDTAPPNHSNHVVFDEDALPVGVATYASAALAALAGGLPKLPADVTTVRST